MKLGMKNKKVVRGKWEAKSRVHWLLVMVFLLLNSYFLLPTSTFAATYTVDNTADSGTGSLRDAITMANSNGEADTITFTISSQTITPLTQLPALSEGFATTIDGTGAKIYLENFIKRWYNGLTSRATCQKGGDLIGYSNYYYL